MSQALVLLQAWDQARSLDPADWPLADAAQGRRLQERVGALRRQRGEREVGFKIGFTNRSIWPLYQVDQTIHAPMWDSTVRQLDSTSAELSPSRWAEPRLEPEIVLGLGRSPDNADPQHLFECLAWIAHGLEIVTSPWPGWRFSAAQAIAAQSLHGALLIGPRHRPSVASGPAQLSQLRLELLCNREPVAQGTGSAVLDGPLQALGSLVAERMARGQPLAAGSIVTTGTLTDAQPMRAGQQWETRLSGIALPGLQLNLR